MTLTMPFTWTGISLRAIPAGDVYVMGCQKGKE